MDYLNKYAKATPKFQAGGEMPAGPEAAPAPGGGGGGDLQSMLMQFAETQDPQLAVQICNMLLQELQGGGGAPAGPAPASAMANGGRMSTSAPMFRKGGKLAV